MIKVCFRIYAYNSEKYIRKTLDSIINQTDGSWLLYLINHGSTDNTGKICEEYAQKDSRIIYHIIKENHKPTEEERAKDKKNRSYIAEKQVKYYAIVDSDDYLSPKFVEVMYEEAKNSNAGLTCCAAAMFYDGEDGKYYFRKPVKSTIYNNSFTSEEFRINYGTLRTVWGKLYTPEEWDYYNDEIYPNSKVVNAKDTYIILTLLIEHTKILRFIDEPLYYYRVRKNSYYSSKPDKQRCYEGGVLLELGKRLANNAKILDSKIMSFLYAVYFNHIKDLIDMMKNDINMSLDEKVEFIEYIFEQKEFREAYNFVGNDINILINDIIINLTKSMQDITKYKLMKSYVFRLYLNIKKLNYSKFNTVWKLGILCDNKNLLNWGNDENNLINSSNKNKIIEIINSPLTKEHNNKKQELLSAIEENDIQKASELLDVILEERLLDREALYFKMYIEAVKKDYCQSIIFAEIARVFWGEDEDIISMINMVYEEIEKVCENT